jgi:ribosomal subunit interface protein
MLTVKDLIQHVEDGAGSDTVLVNLVGVEVDEEKEAIHEKVSTQIRGSIGRKLRNPEELTVHLKKRNTDGKKHRYDLNLRLRSEFGTISVQHEDWDLLDALDSALDKLNKRIGKEKGKKRDRRQ